MASGRIEQQIDLRVTGLKDVKEAEKVVDSLDGTKAKVSVEVDGKAAQRTVKDVIADVKKLDGQDAQIVLALRAAAVEQELTDILQDVARVDGEKATIDVELARAAELRGDLDQLKGAIKEIDDTKATVDIDTSGGRKGFDDVVDGADQANSAVANMVGNASQDMGELAGITGSAGVAVGQLAEYFTDATFKAKAMGQGIGAIASSFAGAALPIVGLSVGIGVVSKIFDGIVNGGKKMAEAIKTATGEAINAFIKVQDEGRSTLDVLDDFAKTEVDKTFADMGASADDVVGTLRSFGVSYDDVVEAFSSGTGPLAKVLGNFEQLNDAAGKGAYEFGNVAKSMGLTTEQALDYYQRAKQVNSALGDQVDVTVAAGEASKGYAAFRASSSDVAVAAAKAEADALDDSGKSAEESAARVKELAAAQQAANDAAQGFADTLSGVDYGKAALDGAVAGMSKFTEQHFALANIAAESEAAFDALGQSLKDNGDSFDLNTEKGRANQEALEGIAHVLDTQLAAAYTESGGSLDTFKGKAQTISDTLKTRLQKEMGLSADKAQALIDKLGLTPTDIETRYQLSGTEEARLKIGLLQSSIDSLPKYVQTQVAQQIITGDYQGALNTIQTYYNNHPPKAIVQTEPGDIIGTVQSMQRTVNNNPIKVPVQFRVGNTLYQDAGGVTGPAGGLAAEAGPEFVTFPDGRRMLLTRPTFVPARSRVTRRTLTERMLRTGSPTAMLYGGSSSTTTRPVQITINTAVLGNRYDIQRAVRGATRDGIRLAGSR